jgi:hypothetical protein
METFKMNNYHEATCKLGAKLARLALTNPSVFTAW